MIFNFIASERQYADHLLPLWHALDPALRGEFWVEQSMLRKMSAAGVDGGKLQNVRPPAGGICVTASIQDTWAVRGQPVVLVEHGAGQGYGEGAHPSYPGGPRREDVILFLCTNESVAERNRRAYPDARVEVIGAPRLDEWVGQPTPGTGEVAVSFHWECPIQPEARGTHRYYANALPQLGQDFPLIGHGHPRIFPFLQNAYIEAGIWPEPEFGQVLQRADVYVCDNSSTLFEFAALGRPVVVLNAPHYRKDVNWGLRFWDWADIGPQVESPSDLSKAIKSAQVNGRTWAKRRDQMAQTIYPHLGSATSRAVGFMHLLAEQFRLVDWRSMRGNTVSNPYASRRSAVSTSAPQPEQTAVVGVPEIPDAPEGTVAEVAAWVGEDPLRARAALSVEMAKPKPRQSLVRRLGAVANGQ